MCARERLYLKSPEDDGSEKYALLDEALEVVPERYKGHGGQEDMEM